jgi:hypothetical protein
MKSTHIALATAITDKQTKHGQHWHVSYDQQYNVSTAYIYDSRFIEYCHETHTISITPTKWPSRTVISAINNLLTLFGIEKRLIKRNNVVKFVAKDEPLSTAEALDHEAWLSIRPARPTHNNGA